MYTKGPEEPFHGVPNEGLWKAGAGGKAKVCKDFELTLKRE